jgi:hypothetical protein
MATPVVRPGGAGAARVLLALAEIIGVGWEDVDLPGFPAFASDEFQAPVDGEDLAGEPGRLRVG